MSSRRIPDPGSLIAGVTFAGVGLIFLVGKVDLADRARWVWPIVLVGLGAGLIAAVLRRTATAAADGPDASATAAAAGPAGLADHTMAGEAGAEPTPAQDGATEDGADEASRAEDRPGGDLPRPHEP
jgi:hypothetical protein